MLPQLLQQSKKSAEITAKHVSVDKVYDAKIPIDIIPNTILKAAGNAKVILIGEASHGTQEFYQIRSQLTQRFLDNDQAFNLVMLEADFPPLYALNKALKSTEKPKNYDAEFEALKSRFPEWMWFNQPTRDFIDYLSNRKTAAILGMDIYSLHRSAEMVIDYLKDRDPGLGKLARQMYSTLGTFASDPLDYAVALNRNQIKPQAGPVSRMLAEITAKEYNLSAIKDGDEYFGCVENARVVHSAEEYYRKAFMGGTVTWNVRDSAMIDSIKKALAFQEKKHGSSRVIVWAHNSHIGDGRQTEHSLEGQRNLGQARNY
jgi:erythromycin esterase-like protein